MAKPVIDIEQTISPDALASGISNKFETWNQLRQVWLKEKVELRNYVYATDTKTTSNKDLPWSNRTTTPRITQIYDTLKAQYEAALFPNSKWMKWRENSVDQIQKALLIQGYMETKLLQGGFYDVADRLLDDYILYGNCFATVSWENNTNDNGSGITVGYTGPVVHRISPLDIVFDPTAASFTDTPKIIRSLVHIGSLKRDNKYPEIFEKMTQNRRTVANGGASLEKSEAFIADGFSSIEHYYGSGYVEILTFYGDIFDSSTGEVLTNRRIVVADRAYVLENEKIATWLGNAPVFNSGWRNRPDSLYAMGPLDNLVGLQYRIDHLENLRADVFDQIAYPMVLVKGEVTDFIFRPGERIITGEEGDVTYLHPDTTALQADFQIAQLERKMEELAGAPRNMLGIRTPGEKTAFEVNQLEAASGRIFQHKAAKLEREFFEPILNSMLESAHTNMMTEEAIRTTDPDSGIDLIRSIKREDIVGSGRIIPIGARHFAERALRVQNINQMLQMKADPSIGAHLSGKRIAQIIAHELGEDSLFEENIAVREESELQKAVQDAEADNLEDLMIAQENGL